LIHLIYPKGTAAFTGHTFYSGRALHRMSWEYCTEILRTRPFPGFC